MNIDELRERLRYFTDHEGPYWDDETAHSKEDEIRDELLRAIATGTAEDPAQMASLALETDNLRFARWYA